MNNTFDLKNHIYVNNEKIYNITLELSGNYLIENNIFGYIYTGIQIIKNCIKLDDNDLDIYLADLNKKEIKYNYFIPKNEKIKLNIHLIYLTQGKQIKKMNILKLIKKNM